MIVAIDGIIYERTGGAGITRTYDEILPRICDLDPQAAIILAMGANVVKPLPDHPRMEHRTLLPVDSWMRPRRLWRQTPFHLRQALLSRIDLGTKTIWHSTYYSLLPKSSVARIVSVYDLIHEQFPVFFHGSGVNAFLQQKRQSILEADCLLCISRTTRDDLCGFFGISAERTRVVLLAPSPVFQPLFASQTSASASKRKPYFLYVGARWGYKNFDSVLRAFATWPRRNDFDLRAVGPPWTQAEIGRLRDLDLEENVHLHTDADDGQLREMYCRAVAFIQPSLYEGFGIPLLEAMACGCPVIASEIPSSVEVAEGSAIFFDPTEPDSLTTALDAVLISGAAQRLKETGLDRAKHFSWDRTASQTLDVYRELLPS